MDFLSLISQNILSPAILFFALGLIAGLLKSDLEVLVCPHKVVQFEY